MPQDSLAFVMENRKWGRATRQKRSGRQDFFSEILERDAKAAIKHVNGKGIKEVEKVLLGMTDSFLVSIYENMSKEVEAFKIYFCRHNSFEFRYFLRAIWVMIL